MVIDNLSLRQLLGRFPTGVTVVTAPTEKDRPAAATANAFAAVSLTPPMVLVCLGQGSRTQIAIRRSSQFAIHFLTDSQERVARTLATPGANKATAVAWNRSPRGNYLLPRYLALLECTLACEYAGGDHSIFVGHVVAIDSVEEEDTPLLYYSGRMGRLSPCLADVDPL